MSEETKLDQFHAHEALHTTSVVQDIFDRHVAEHPYIQSNDELKKFAEKIAEDIAELYQMLGGIIFLSDKENK